MNQLDYKLLFENVPAPYQVLNAQGNIVAVNNAWLELSEYCMDEVIGQHISKFMPSSYLEKFYHRSQKLNIDSSIPLNTLKFTSKSGTEKDIEITGSIKKNLNGEFETYCIFHDVTNKKQMQDIVYFIAHYDLLTNIPNKASLEMELKNVVHRTQRNKTNMALVFIGLDNFTSVNEEYGNKIGDEILKEVARDLESVVRQSDYLARLKGDIFAIILENLPEVSNMENIISKFLNVVNKSYNIHDFSINICATAGYTIYPTVTEHLEQLISHTETALFLAKKTERCSSRIYSNES